MFSLDRVLETLYILKGKRRREAKISTPPSVGRLGERDFEESVGIQRQPHVRIEQGFRRRYRPGALTEMYSERVRNDGDLEPLEFIFGALDQNPKSRDVVRFLCLQVMAKDVAAAVKAGAHGVVIGVSASSETSGVKAIYRAT